MSTGIQYTRTHTLKVLSMSVFVIITQDACLNSLWFPPIPQSTPHMHEYFIISIEWKRERYWVWERKKDTFQPNCLQWRSIFFQMFVWRTFICLLFPQICQCVCKCSSLRKNEYERCFSSMNNFNWKVKQLLLRLAKSESSFIVYNITNYFCRQFCKWICFDI